MNTVHQALFADLKTWTYTLHGVTLDRISQLRQLANTHRDDLLIELDTDEPFTGNLLDFAVDCRITLYVHKDGMSLEHAAQLCGLTE